MISDSVKRKTGNAISKRKKTKRQTIIQETTTQETKD